MRYLAALFVVLSLSGVVKSQTISPVIAACSIKQGKVCGGEFSVENIGIAPLFVTLEKRSASLTADGSLVLRSLDSGVDLVVSEGSARISPKAKHVFQYKLTCDKYPCLTYIFASMVVGKSPTGVEVRLSLPEGIYACDGTVKAQDCRAAVRREAGIPEGK